MKSQDNLREQMLEGAQLILRSVSFYESEINKKMAQIDEAENNKFVEDLPRLSAELQALIIKIGKENIIMTNFLVKYRKLIHNEKQKILYNN